MIQSIKITIDGKEYDGFTEAVVTKSIETLAGTFTFTATQSTNTIKETFPIKIGAKCIITINGVSIINGYVEKIRINYDKGTHDLKISGRDRTADIIDSTLGGITFKTPITLKQITRGVLKKLNISDIEIIDNTNSRVFSQGPVGAEFGVTAFDFLEKYARKRQVLLTTDGNGNIVYTRTPGNQYKTQLILENNAPATITSATITYDNQKVFNKYLCKAQSNPSGMQQFFSEPVKIAGSDSKPVIDKNIRTSRVYNFQADFNAESETLIDRAKWEANFRRSQSKKWEYVVEGHIAKDDDDIWKPGYFVKVQDEFANLDSVLLISSVTYTENLSDGTKTTLELLTKDAFSLEVTKPEKSEDTSQEGLQQFFSVPTSQVEKQTSGTQS